METIAAELVETGAKKDVRGRRLANREEAEALIRAYEGSGLTQREFAKREGIKFFTFTGWLKRYRASSGRKTSFAQVRVTSPTARPEMIVALPSGIVVRGTNPGQMAELIKELGC